MLNENILDSLRFEHHDGVTTGRMVERLADVYIEARSDAVYASNSIWTRESFLERTLTQVNSDGFAAITAKLGCDIVGFSFGFTMGKMRTFHGTAALPTQYLEARKFAVIELDVIPSWRRQGLARIMLNDLLIDREESFAILLVRPNTWVSEMYARWGWSKVSESLPDSGLPPLDVLATSLNVAPSAVGQHDS